MCNRNWIKGEDNTILVLVYKITHEIVSLISLLRMFGASTSSAQRDINCGLIVSSGNRTTFMLSVCCRNELSLEASFSPLQTRNEKNIRINTSPITCQIQLPVINIFAANRH